MKVTTQTTIQVGVWEENVPINSFGILKIATQAPFIFDEASVSLPLPCNADEGFESNEDGSESVRISSQPVFFPNGIYV